ncbi:MAG: hypothetical protein ACYCTE_16450 [Acidimicrobiales bacterium]
MILGPSTRRGVWHVDCAVHGAVGTQTTAAYGIERTQLHRDEVGCAAPAIVVGRDARGRWRASCPGCASWDVERSSKALVLVAGLRHAESCPIDLVTGGRVGVDSAALEPAV